MADSEKETKDAPDEAQRIELLRQPIDLYKILKFEGLVGSGGEAKAAIAGGMVLVNDEVETQKRKKIVSGDTIRFGDILYRIHCDVAPEPKQVRVDKKSAAEAEKPKPKKKDWRKRTMAKKARRKAIGIKT